MVPGMRRKGGRRALIAGATGLVGEACLRCLLDRPEYGRIVALVRRPLGLDDARLEQHVVDFARPEHFRPVAADDAFCAVGTTLAKAGSKEAFRGVDYLATLAVADFAVASGATQFVLVSSVGADPASGNFYLSVKGEAEAAVTKRPFRGTHILRPGLLLGDRAESRPVEALARSLAPLFNPILLASLRPYRAVPAATVGRAMVAAALEGQPGRHVVHYDDILRLASRLESIPRP
jgi:uncharacterized protein YbjT (DUF2867 family)